MDLIEKWLKQAKYLESQDSSKWYSSMSEEERKDFNYRHTQAYIYRVCSRELREFLAKTMPSSCEEKR